MSGIYPLIGGESKIILQHFKTSVHFYFIIFFTFVCLSYPIKNITWEKAIKIWLFNRFVNAFGVIQIVARAFNLPFAWLDYNNIRYDAKNNTGG